MKNKDRIKMIAASMLTLMSSFMMMPITGYASDINHDDVPITVEMNNAFAESEGEYDYIERKKEEENANITGLIDEDVEILLNDNGVLDEDIEKWNDEEREALEENINEDSVIAVSYYAVNDIEELSDVPVQEDEMVELTSEQVNKYIAEKYYDEETDLTDELNKQFDEELESNEKTEVINTISNLIGLEVKDVCAETIAHGGTNDKEHPSMLRETLVISELKDGETMHVWFKFEWTDMPTYREVDTIGLYWDGAFYDSCDSQYDGKTNVLHSWYENYISYYSNGKPKVDSTKYGDNKLSRYYNSTNMGIESYCIREDNLCCVIKLHNDDQYRVNPTVDLEYEYESVAMNFYLKKDYKRKGVSFHPKYIHVKKRIEYEKGKLISGVTALFGKNYLTATYYLISGAEEFSVESYSGPYNAPFEHTYK